MGTQCLLSGFALFAIGFSNGLRHTTSGFQSKLSLRISSFPFNLFVSCKAQIHFPSIRVSLVN